MLLYSFFSDGKASFDAWKNDKQCGVRMCNFWEACGKSINKNACGLGSEKHVWDLDARVD